MSKKEAEKKKLDDLDKKKRDFIRTTFMDLIGYSRQEPTWKILSKKRRAKMEPTWRV